MANDYKSKLKGFLKEFREDKYKGKSGVWKTVRGRHVFIEEGKTLEQALGHKPGVENQKKIDETSNVLKQKKEELKKLLDRQNQGGVKQNDSPQVKELKREINSLRTRKDKGNAFMGNREHFKK